MTAIVKAHFMDIDVKLLLISTLLDPVTTLSKVPFAPYLTRDWLVMFVVTHITMIHVAFSVPNLILIAIN